MISVATSQPQQTQHTLNAQGEYHITFEPILGRVIAKLHGKTIVDSSNAMILRERGLSPVYYFNREDIRMDLLTATDHTSFCPFRGNASYFDVTVGEHTETNIAWSYEQPLSDSAYVKNYVAFYANRLDDVEIISENGTIPEVNENYAHNPLVGWLLEDAWQATSIADLVARLVQQLEIAGIPILRLTVVVRTLHPQLLGASYRWTRDTQTVTETQVTHEALEQAVYLDSPLYPVFEGAGGVRRRLRGPGANLDFPVLTDIYEEGGTDYVAMPVVFSDGQLNAITVATDGEGGFSTEQLGQLYEIIPLFSRLVEVFMQREKSETLLGTYLGKHSGQKVLDGQIKRGDGSDIHAVIWFCDLRDSSRLARELSRREFLDRLNCFFDCMAGAVLDHGGEVLRFIGDAALAIFPLDGQTTEDGFPLACRNALEAAHDAVKRVRTNNSEHDSQSIDFGIGLHIGDVSHGNIGTHSRLEFTVIGSAANEAARIESLSKVVKSPVLISQEFVDKCGGDYVDLGEHELRGTGLTTRLYKPMWCKRGPASIPDAGLNE